MESSIMLITPDIARSLLSKSNGNYRYANQKKTVDDSIVKKYAIDMTIGNWRLNPHGIVLDTDGTLIDGHHRLNAVILANKPIEFVVVTNAPKNCINSIDSGFARKPYLSLAYTDGINKAAASPKGWSIARMHYLFLHLGNKDEVKAIPSSVFGEFIIRNAEDIEKAIKITKHINNKTKITENASNYYTALCAIKSGANIDKINRFFEIVTSGMYDSKEESAAIIYRNKVLQSYKTRDHSYNMHLSEYAQTALRDFLERKARSTNYQKVTAVFTKYCIENDLL